MTPVSTYVGWDPAQRGTIMGLASAAARSSESAVLLCACGQLWDAEVLVRSSLEASLKIAYLLQTCEDFTLRCREYSEDLFGVSLLKDHARAAKILALVNDPLDGRWQPIRDLILSDADLAGLTGRYPKSVRGELETRWGFTGIVGELSRSGDLLLKDLQGLAHGYALASHIQHADTIGASLPMERESRPDCRRDAVILAHEGRILTDLLWYGFLRLSVGYRFVGADPAPLGEIRNLIEEATRPFEGSFEDWGVVEFGFPPPRGRDEDAYQS
ncbi:hypothetical protein [Antarcticirhabdus aurantiaca]|uniref:Uncharacterized protein n=1 Tax=Antarcticirhabdus aurantiaca TaxID=2606717 RepID=A0ACD4NP16_9HYPH|nr:hypothetical protein [Antarcticirhabdus aurantiaca]WAJ28507.1 hypothetical protein OXU80_27500 [Jeongeuplla avenae]